MAMNIGSKYILKSKIIMMGTLKQVYTCQHSPFRARDRSPWVYWSIKTEKKWCSLGTEKNENGSWVGRQLCFWLKQLQ